MLVSDVVALAKAGELQQLAIKDDDVAVISFINLGLIEIYKRFPLRTEEFIIALQDNVTIYNMPSDFMYIISAYDEAPADALGQPLTYGPIPVPINEENSPFSINTVSYNQIQVPLTTNGAYISIIYAVKPTLLTVADLATEIAIPDALVEALLNYIGYRGHGSVDGSLQTETNTHYMRFESSCRRARELGVAIATDSLDMTLRFQDRGFV